MREGRRDLRATLGFVTISRQENRVSRRLVRSIVVLALIAGVARGEQTPEYQVKAEFVERFTRFIDWPAGTDGHGAFLIGIIGDNPFNGYLQRMAADRRIKGRAVEIRHLTDPTQVDACQIVFICGSERDRLRKILNRTESKPILTISDSAGFAASGVLINFYMSGETVRFEMNESAIERSGLKVSSRLLKLARLVDPAGVR
jgi:hypothetical protein